MIKFLLPSMFAVILLFPASAQVGPGGPAMQCTPSVSVTPTLRSEGFTERVGDLILFCTGGVPRSAGQALPTARIEIYFNTGVTNRVYAGGWSDAMLIIDEPNSGLSGTSDTQLACADPAGACTILANGAGTGAYDGTAGRPNVFPGTAGSYGNSVKFSDIPMYAPGSGARILRFTNIRVNATSISAVTPTPVIASISSSGDLPL